MKQASRAASLALSAALLLGVSACTGAPAAPSATPSPIPSASAPVQSATPAPEASPSALSFTAGTYTASAEGHNGPVTVETVFSANAIDDVAVASHAETAGIGDLAVERIPGEIVAAQSLAIDAVAGATYTSQAILDAVADCVAQAGGDSAALMAAGDSAGETIERTADIVIVGAGAAGLMAAEKAADAGYQVLVLEKGATAAVSNFSQAGGPSASETKVQAAEGVEVTNETLYNHMYEFSRGNVNAALLRECISHSGEAVDLMVDLGIPFVLIPDTYGVGFRGRQMFMNGGLDRTSPVTEAIEAKGGEILYETAGESLIQDAGGTVTGVLAKHGKDTVKVTAKAVLVCTGGYLGSEEMLAQHFPGATVVPLGNELSTGDGINMALAAGATLDRNFALLGNEGGAASAKLDGPVYNPDFTLINDNLGFWIFGGLAVDATGSRFVNEKKVADFPLAFGGEVIARAGKAYMVMDSAYYDACTTVGPMEFLGNPESWLSGKALWSPALLKGPEQLQEAVDQGWAYKADTLAEAAEHFGLDSLEETVANYNEMCKNGVDTEFGKDPAFLTPVETGPFYVFEYDASAWGTIGGVKVDSRLRALDGENRPIPGLYVAGVDAGSMYTSPYYDNEGACLGLALGSGRYAAECMADYIG